jgi:hypothetical protein
VSLTVVEEIIDDILEFMLEGWLFGEHKVANRLPESETVVESGSYLTGTVQQRPRFEE